MRLYKTKHDDIVVFKIFNNLNDSLMWAVISLNRGWRSRSAHSQTAKFLCLNMAARLDLQPCFSSNDFCAQSC